VQPPAAPLWYDDSHKDYIANKGWKDPKDAITAYQNLEKLIPEERAGRTIFKPKDANDVEGIKAFRAALGVPADLTGYKIPDALKEDPMIKGFAEVALKEGIPATAFESVTAWALQAAEEQQKASERQIAAHTAAELDKLKGEWGREFDQRSEFARRFLRESGWDDAKMERYEMTFGTAALLRDFWQWGSKTGEQQFVDPNTGAANSGGASAMELNRQITNLKREYMENRITKNEYDLEMARLGPKLAALQAA